MHQSVQLDADYAAIDAVRQGQRVLVVIRTRRSGFGRHVRRAIGTAMVLSPAQITVLTGACVDGVKSIEAVVVRQLRTRRLIGFNASALLVFGLL